MFYQNLLNFKSMVRYNTHNLQGKDWCQVDVMKEEGPAGAGLFF